MGRWRLSYNPIKMAYINNISNCHSVFSRNNWCMLRDSETRKNQVWICFKCKCTYRKIFLDCKWGIGIYFCISYAGVGYADDVGLLTPSIQALQKLLYVCEDSACDYNILFNAKKTVCMRGRSNGEPPTRVVTLNGAAVMWKQSIKRLGNITTADLSDKCDIERRVCIPCELFEQQTVSDACQCKRATTTDILLLMVWLSDLGPYQ